jgi:cysteinyl-tRNA synthetase
VLRDHDPAAVRLLLLDRRWPEAWEYRPAQLDAAASRLADLYAAAGRPAGSPAAAGAVTAALRDDLDVPRAVEVALTDGGEAARLLLRTLSLA